MRRVFLVALFSTPIVLTAMSTASLAAADPVPCEKALADLRTAIKSVTLVDADKAKISDLEQQGLERCKADDDAGADSFFAEAMKIIGK